MRKIVLVLWVTLLAGSSGCERAKSRIDKLGQAAGVPGGPLTIITPEQAVFVGEQAVFQVRSSKTKPGATFEWGLTASGTTCHNHQDALDPSVMEVQCLSTGSLRLSATVRNPDGVAFLYTYEGDVLTNPIPPPPAGTFTKTFRIPAGTGKSSWNTPATAVTLAIGDVLRIYNDDSVPHQLHVDRYNSDPLMNAHPCRHSPMPLQPGEYYDCVVNQPYDPAVHPIHWDHLSGTSARFYINAVN